MTHSQRLYHTAQEREAELHERIAMLQGQVETVLTSLSSYDKDLAEHHRRVFKEIDDE